MPRAKLISYLLVCRSEAGGGAAGAGGDADAAQALAAHALQEDLHDGEEPRPRPTRTL